MDCTLENTPAITHTIATAPKQSAILSAWFIVLKEAGAGWGISFVCKKEISLSLSPCLSFGLNDADGRGDWGNYNAWIMKMVPLLLPFAGRGWHEAREGERQHPAIAQRLGRAREKSRGSKVKGEGQGESLPIFYSLSNTILYNDYIDIIILLLLFTEM